jgi:hypothetical protein
MEESKEEEGGGGGDETFIKLEPTMEESHQSTTTTTTTASAVSVSVSASASDPPETTAGSGHPQNYSNNNNNHDEANHPNERKRSRPSAAGAGAEATYTEDDSPAIMKPSSANNNNNSNNINPYKRRKQQQQQQHSDAATARKNNQKDSNSNNNSNNNNKNERRTSYDPPGNTSLVVLTGVKQKPIPNDNDGQQNDGNEINKILAEFENRFTQLTNRMAKLEEDSKTKQEQINKLEAKSKLEEQKISKLEEDLQTKEINFKKKHKQKISKLEKESSDSKKRIEEQDSTIKTLQRQVQELKEKTKQLPDNQTANLTRLQVPRPPPPIVAPPPPPAAAASASHVTPVAAIRTSRTVKQNGANSNSNSSRWDEIAQGWECDVCNNYNTNMRRTCIVCRSQRPPTVTSHRAVATTQASSDRGQYYDTNVDENTHGEASSPGITENEIYSISKLCRENRWRSLRDMLKRKPQLSLVSFVTDKRTRSTILHEAIISEDTSDIGDRSDCIQDILSRCPEAAKIKHGRGSLPLHSIARRSKGMDPTTRESLFKKLIAAYPEALVTKKDDNLGRTPVHVALQRKY